MYTQSGGYLVDAPIGRVQGAMACVSHTPTHGFIGIKKLNVAEIFAAGYRQASYVLSLVKRSEVGFRYQKTNSSTIQHIITVDFAIFSVFFSHLR